ncbi:methyltransferase family protein [Hyphomonas sp.]|uniref:methyltransferase family protein n=1 Tax=Hyphomonas sp. TaxID=87 RepID=UPI003D2BEC40
MTKILMLIYALLAYLVGLASILYIVGFLADIGVPKAISDGVAPSLIEGVLVDTGLVAIFGLHHSITARSAFKRWWVRIIPAPIERATYLFMTAFMTGILVSFWQPIPITIWQVEHPFFVNLIRAGYAGVWVMMVAATFHFGHFSFLGLTQAWRVFRQTIRSCPDMSARYLYAIVRHPISLGWMVAPFLVPHFTVGHLVFAVATLVYIALATPFEEADLVEEIGAPYQAYQQKVPKFIPFMKPTKQGSELP